MLDSDPAALFFTAMNTRAIHQELHFTAGETLRDMVIGMAGGLAAAFAFLVARLFG